MLVLIKKGDKEITPVEANEAQLAKLIETYGHDSVLDPSTNQPFPRAETESAPHEEQQPAEQEQAAETQTAEEQTANVDSQTAETEQAADLSGDPHEV